MFGLWESEDLMKEISIWFNLWMNTLMAKHISYWFYKSLVATDAAICKICKGKSLSLVKSGFLSTCRVPDAEMIEQH
jgi:hypothetical protein